MVLFLQQGRSGLVRAVGFVAGGIAVRLAQGILFGLVFGAAMEANSEDGQRLGVYTLLLIVGILLLIRPSGNCRRRRTPTRRRPSR